MSTAAFRHPREHVADLLPAFINGSLDAGTRFVVQRHLARCGDCMRSLAAWRAIADATRAGVARHERRIAAEASAPALAAVPVSRSTNTYQETDMHTSTFTPATIAAPLRLPKRPAIGRALQPLARIAAVMAIALSVGVGILAFLNSGPDRGPRALAPAAAAHQKDACTATPLTDAQIAAAVYLPGTLDGSNRDQATYLDPAVPIVDPNNLPAGTAADQATTAAVAKVWTGFQACLGDNNAALSFMSQDGLRRTYYRYVYENIQTTFLNQQAAEAKVQARDAAKGGATPTAEAKPYPNGAPPEVNYTPASPQGFEIAKLVVLPDGRVLASLDNPNAQSGSASVYDGIAVFVKNGDAWQIDDYTIFQG